MRYFNSLMVTLGIAAAIGLFLEVVYLSTHGYPQCGWAAILLIAWWMIHSVMNAKPKDWE